MIDPLTSIVDPIRTRLFRTTWPVSPQSLNVLHPGVTLGGARPTGTIAGLVAAMAWAMLGIAIAEFRKNRITITHCNTMRWLRDP